MERIMLVRKGNLPLYVQIYNYFKNSIEQGHFKENEKLPSIRGLAANLGVSKITVEMAYQQLLNEGYILNANRARFTIASLEKQFFLDNSRRQDALVEQIKSIPKKPKIEYDFASGSMDPEGFNFALWKRYLNKALDESQRLVGYAHLQGEEELREQIVRYLYQSRGVNVRSSQIIVGPGVQSILRLLSSLLKDKYQSIAFEDPGFKNGLKIFKDYGFRVFPISMGPEGIDLQPLRASGSNLVYLSPSHQFPTGSVMSIGKRIQMLSWAEETKSLIIEDDYDSEFRYYGRPIPALKGLDQRDNVIYLGSFSKIMPPSLRISYIVLPWELLQLYQSKSSLYKQAASTLEQLALAYFMADGQLDKQTRRLRKLYQEKRTIFFNSIQDILGKNVILEEKEAGLFTTINVLSDLSVAELKSRALEQGCRVAALEDYSMLSSQKEKHPKLLLYFSGIERDKIKSGIELLYRAWF